MRLAREELVVHLDAPELGPSRPVGVLRRARAGATTDVAFQYDSAWLGSADRIDIDPAFGLWEGEQRPPGGGLAGAFADTAPDRWGRTLLERREARAARREGRSVRILDDWDFLVGVSDDLRMGALRLARPDGAFVAEGRTAVPPMARLRSLQYHAEQVERGAEVADQEADDEITLLIAPGSSLGGARPKANFRNTDDELWIAKFPSREDRRDVGAWEYLLNVLAGDAGVTVPPTALLELTGPYRTFCADRFDRDGAARRFFVSAMTLLEKRDGDSASYLEIVEAIEQHGDPKAIEEDLEQLFRRLVFNVAAGHRDDHLRNHGFLRTMGGWRLGPCFDLNPLPEKREHTLAIDEALRLPDLDLARETAPFYRLTSSRAGELVGQVLAAVAPWRERARACNILRDEIDLMSAAFLV